MKNWRRSTGTSMRMARLRSRRGISARMAHMMTAITSAVTPTSQLRARASTRFAGRWYSKNVGSASSRQPFSRYTFGARVAAALSRSKYLSKLFSDFWWSEPSYSAGTPSTP